MKNKSSERKAETMRRCRIAAALLAACLFGAAAANAQRLWSVGEVSRPADGPAVAMGDARLAPRARMMLGTAGIPGVATGRRFHARLRG